MFKLEWHRNGGVVKTFRCTPQVSVMADQSKAVRRMSRADASAEAIRLASVLLSEDQDDRWVFTIVNASPCSFDPRPVGKTPSRWFVGTTGKLKESPDTIMDGADPMIVVDLVAGTAEWIDENNL